MSRTKDILIEGFDNIQILQRYLYMSEDHFIEIINRIGVKLQIRMGADLDYWCKNMNFPDLPDMNWSERMTTRTMLSIIEQLKNAPAVQFPERFSSRWEEIQSITMMNVWRI